MAISPFKQGPMWARPRMPFEDIAAGTRSGAGFNPGNYFGSATSAAGTAGGHTLPSLQRWNRLAPSEKSMQQGIWADEAQLHTPDIFALMNRLRPTTAKTWAPRWFGGY